MAAPTPYAYAYTPAETQGEEDEFHLQKLQGLLLFLLHPRHF